jgi:hypothetical protein
MVQTHTVPRQALPVWKQHWPVLLTGMGMAAAGALLSYAWSSGPPVIRLVFMGGGLLLAGQAVVLRLRPWREAIEERVESAAVIVLAGFTALIDILGIDKDWDSADMVLKGLLVVAVIGFALVLLPNLYRRVAFSFILLYHLFGIFVMVTYLAPPGPGGAPAPFLSNKIWTYAYRPYLEFVCINNAYHFYSPEPGPPTLLWFKLNYLPDGAHYKLTKDSLNELNDMLGSAGVKLEDRDKLRAQLGNLKDKEYASNEEFSKALAAVVDKEFLERYKENVLDHAWNLKSQWVKLPNREDSPVNLHFQRLLSITESCNSLFLPVPPEMVTAATPRRLTIGQIHGIPPHPGETVPSQFQPPTPFSANLTLPSAVRRIAGKHATLADDPTARLVSIKFYRVRHTIIQPGMLAEGHSPLHPSQYYPFYMGEFFPNGENVNASNDPYLYWLIPIYVDAADKLQDSLERHAGLVYNRMNIERAKGEAKP